ncbi:MAG: adenosine deaminase [Arachnia sp.]
MLSIDDIRPLPKVALHDHLDGGLRPATVIELCAEAGHELPTTDADELGRWFFEAADSGSLVRYLETFDHTVAAMQTAEHLARVAREFVVDQALDGVVYAEARWAPEQHEAKGMTRREAVEAVRDGLAEGMAEAAALGHPIVARQIVTSMRHVAPTVDTAQLAIDFRDDSVCGFDIAGAEDGFPAARWLPAFELLKRANMFITIHAGEADGPTSIWEAVQQCGGNRVGHGVRIVEDIEIVDGTPRLGRLAAYVRDAQVPLEVAPSSNLQTGIAGTMAEHPVNLLKELGFNVTINCDNRLMSSTTMSREFALLSETFGWTIDDVERCTLAAMNAAFLPLPEREAIIRDVIRPAYAAAAL